MMETSEVRQKQFLSQKKIVEEKAKNTLKHYDIKIGTTIVQKKQPQFKQTGGEDIVTNIYPMNMKKKIETQHYHVKIIACVKLDDGNVREGPILTAPIESDYQKTKRRQDCKAVMDYMIATRTDLFQGFTTYYDLQSILFSSIPIKGFKPQGANAFEIDGVQVNGFNYFKIELECVSSVMIGEMKGVINNVSEESKKLEQFLNIASSQAIFNNDNFVTFSASRGYMYDPRPFGFTNLPIFNDNRSTLAIGFNKTVRPIDGGTDKLPTGVEECTGGMGMLVDCKKTPFHIPDERLVDKAIAILGRGGNINNVSIAGISTLNKALKELSVRASHRQNQTHIITVQKIVEVTAQSYKINRENHEINLVQYYQEKYETVLQFPNAPLVQTQEIFRGEKRVNFYPMELCIVCDNQRVKTHQMTGMMNSEMIKLCAAQPDKLMQEISGIKTSFGLHDTDHLRAIEVSVADQPLLTKAKVLPPPGIVSGNKQKTNVDSMNTSWKINTFYQAIKIQHWGIFAFNSRSDRTKVNTNDLQNFIRMYTEALKNSGVEYSEPDIIVFEDTNADKLKNFIMNDAMNKYEFILIAHPDQADDMHHMMKFCELKAMNIVTQGVLFRTVHNVIRKNQRQTIQNIANKTNVKLGGLNYIVMPPAGIPRVKTMIENGTLFIGFGMNHPAGGMGMASESLDTSRGSGGNGDGNGGGNGAGNGGNGNGHGEGSGHSDGQHGRLHPPSVIGYAANTMKDPFAFNGGFCYQEPRQEARIETIGIIVAFSLQKYSQVHGKFPERIIIYRHGPSEGMFKFILECEIPMIKYSINNFSGKDIPLTYMVPNKLQPIRFFKKNIRRDAKAPEKNISPGTVIDSGVCHPCITEFYLNAHRTLQGTARVPCYTTLIDDNNMTLEELENITYILCYGHQIVFNGPTSLPTPVYVGEMYAKRGRNLYNSYVEDCDNGNGSHGNGDGGQFGHIRTYDELTEALGHQNIDWLGWRRVNA